MKLRVRVREIHCDRTTIETSPDEIYFAYYVAQAKKKGDSGEARFVAGHLSDVWRGVTRGEEWKPAGPQEFEIDNDSEHVALAFALYEKDDGKLREELKSAAKPIDSKAPWESLSIPWSQGWSAWAKAVLKFLFGLLKQIKRDDGIGRADFSFNPKTGQGLGVHRFDLRGFGGKYGVKLEVTKG